jgi:hypothetical protein
MENNNSWVWILVIILAFFVLFHEQKYEGLTAEEWYYEYSDAEDRVEDAEERASEYEYALDDANSNIEDAKSYAWESYEDMGDALDYLETVEP